MAIPSTNDPIFQPLTINGVTFKNRIVRSSLGGRIDYYDGSMSDARIAWDRRFAVGGVAAIISSNAGIRTDGIAVPGYASIDDDRRIPSWRKLISEIQKHDCRYIIQLHFSGRQRDIPRKEFTHVLAMSSTNKPDLLYGLRCRRMTISEIHELTDDYGRAAHRAREAGADGVEIVACNGYILHQFLSGAINDRTDDYGGQLRARARFLLEVVASVRENQTSVRTSGVLRWRLAIRSENSRGVDRRTLRCRFHRARPAGKSGFGPPICGRTGRSG
jgi:2,4-dienoyl-CoA reductase (NADPH2)